MMKVSLVSIPVPNPIEAHEIYTSRLGFVSKEFDPDADLAIVASPDDLHGTAILLEPCKGNFAGEYQKSAFEANLPIMVLAVPSVKDAKKRMALSGIRLRPELDNPKWGLENIFEDGCGNLLMLEELQ